MITDFKQNFLNAVRKGNCPAYKQDSHACFDCPYGDLGDNTYNCLNSKYDKPLSYKVKPQKIKNKKMKIVIDKITGGYVSIKTIDKGEQILFEMFKDKEKKE